MKEAILIFNRKFRFKIIISVLLAVLVLAGGYRYVQSNRSRLTSFSLLDSNHAPHRPVKTADRQSARTTHSRLPPVGRTEAIDGRLQRVTSDAPLLKIVDQKRPVPIGSTKSLTAPNVLVKPFRMVKDRNDHTYVQVSRGGKNLGWLDAKCLKPTRQYLLPYQYCSQFYPSPVDDACELAALKMALSTQGKALNVSLRQMVKSVPRSNKPWKGYTNNPYRYGSHASLYPNMMVKCANHYGARAKDLTGATQQQLISEITHGNGVVIEGSYLMRKPHSDHSISLLGYKPGYFYFAEPFARHPSSPKAGWVPVGRAMDILSKPYRGRRAMAVE